MVMVEVESTLLDSRPTVPKARSVASTVQSFCTVAVTLNLAVWVAAGASAAGRIIATDNRRAALRREKSMSPPASASKRGLINIRAEGAVIGRTGSRCPIDMYVINHNIHYA